MKAIQPKPETFARGEDLLTELLLEMAKDVDYAFDHTTIKRQAYHPKAFNIEDEYIQEIRSALVELLKGKTSVRIRPGYGR